MRNGTRRKKWSRDCLCQSLRGAGQNLGDAYNFLGLTGYKRHEKAICRLISEVNSLLTWAMALPVTPEEKLAARDAKKRNSR